MVRYGCRLVGIAIKAVMLHAGVKKIRTPISVIFNLTPTAVHVVTDLVMTVMLVLLTETCLF